MVRTRTAGFTIVELIIIVVTIAILAAIGVMAYNGIQERAKLQVARSEMMAFAKSATIFQQMTGNSPVAQEDFVYILKESGLYEKTRTEEKNFAICASTSGYAFVAWNPIVDGIKRGDTLYLYKDANGQNVHTLTNSSLESNLQLAKVCDQVYESSTYETWTHTLP